MPSFAIPWSALAREARTRFGVAQLRPEQRALIDAILRGKNALGVLPTGAGKSLCFQLPALFLPKPVIVVSPLLALMRDQQQKLEDADVASAKLDSTLTAAETARAIAAIEHGEKDIVYVTPERLENPEYLEVLRARGASLLVVDEAHCVSQWGHDFRPAYLAIRDAVRALGCPPVLALTATAPPPLAEDILHQLAIEDVVVVRAGIERPNIFYEVLRTPSDEAKRTRLAEILARERGAGIVYVATIRLADELTAWLRDRGTPALEYHGKLPARERKDAQDRFMSGEVPVIVATNAFGLGIDKPDVRFVVHYTFPDSLETYYQESGRAGRDGEAARATLLFRLEDRRIQSYFLGGKYPRAEESTKVYELVAGGASSVASIAKIAALPERRVRVIVALLEKLGVVERRGRKLVKRREFATGADFEAFVSEYAQRHESDRERLDAMMRWAETTACRGRAIEEWFGEHPDSDCGHCDNCRDQPARAIAARLEAEEHAKPTPTMPEHEKSAFAEGEAVRHRRFGAGEVVRIDGAKATVKFARVGTKTVQIGYLRAAS